MSLISGFIANRLLAALEAELVNHEQDIQEAVIKEVEALVALVGDWVQKKLAGAQPKQ